LYLFAIVADTIATFNYERSNRLLAVCTLIFASNHDIFDMKGHGCWLRRRHQSRRGTKIAIVKTLVIRFSRATLFSIHVSLALQLHVAQRLNCIPKIVLQTD